MKSARKKSIRRPRKAEAPKKATPELRRRRFLVRDENGLRLISQREHWRAGPVVAAIQWVEKHADGFNRLALLIDAADYMNERRNVEPEAANHVAIGLTMMREELRNLRKRLRA